jgi:hypothetical protein
MGRINNERLLVNILIVIGVGFILDQAVLNPWLDSRDALMAQRETGRQALELGKLTLQQEKDLRQFLAGDGASMMSDSATVEGQLLHLVHDWGQQTSITNLSFLRTMALEEHGFTRLTFSITANGALPPLAGLIYRVETSPIPLRIESTVIHQHPGGGDELQLNLTVSALCHAKSDSSPVQQAPADNSQVSEVRP